MTREHKTPEQNKRGQADSENPENGYAQVGKDGDSTPQNTTEEATPAGEPRNMVKQFFRKGEAFIEELLNENERLRMHVMHLESRLHESKAEVPSSENTAELQAILERLKQEHEDLRQRYDEMVSETQKHKARYENIEEENDKLANLFVASYQLHSTMELEEALRIVTEILLNFVGAGRFALFIREKDILEPVSSYGITINDLSPVDMNEPWVQKMTKPAKPHVAALSLQPGEFEQDKPVACLPLHIQDSLTGAIFIYSFLQQKLSISPVDMELFNLLSEHTAVVLEGARLFKEAGKEPAGANKFKALLDSGNKA